MNIYKNKFLSRFGLMHMIATNLCVWLNVLILETSHEIHETHHHSGGHGAAAMADHGHGHVDHKADDHKVEPTVIEIENGSLPIVARHLKGGMTKLYGEHCKNTEDFKVLFPSYFWIVH